jgi:hypothetical protein
MSPDDRAYLEQMEQRAMHRHLESLAAIAGCRSAALSAVDECSQLREHLVPGLRPAPWRKHVSEASFLMACIALAFAIGACFTR